MNVNSDHVFGIIAQPDEYGAGDLINMRNEKTFSLRGKEREHGFLAAIRQHLKKANYHNFTDLKSAFEFYDKVRYKFLSDCTDRFVTRFE